MKDIATAETYNQKVLVGCGLIGVVLFFICGGLIVASVYFDRQAGRYPEAELISAHANYASLPRQFRWDDTYVSDADFRTVYRWYSGRFDLGTEAAANGRCTYAESYQQQLIATRYVGLLLCDSPKGTMIFINRTTTLKR